MLSLLLSRPRTVEEWNRWSLHHKNSHDQIRAAIKSAGGRDLQPYFIDPISLTETKSWLEANQQLHVDMNGQLGIPGSDLQDLDFNDDHQTAAWIYLHWQEHNVAENRLRIGS